MSDQDVVTTERDDQMLRAVVQHAQLNEETTREMQEAVLAAAAEDRALPVVLDLSKVEFFPSLSLGALVTVLQDCKGGGQVFALVGVQPAVRGVLAVTRLDKLFEIYDSTEEALARMGK